MSTSFLTASFCMAWEWGIMVLRCCDAVMRGRTAVLPLKLVQPNPLSLEFESIKRLYRRPQTVPSLKGGVRIHSPGNMSLHPSAPKRVWDSGLFLPC